MRSNRAAQRGSSARGEERRMHSIDTCRSRVWDKWTFSDKSLSFLVPDISRVFRRPIDGNRVNTKYLEALFNRKRRTSL